MLTLYWDQSSNKLSVDVGNDGIDLNYTKDIVTDIFGGDSMVYLGITAATGNLNYAHSVCILGPAVPTMSQWSLITLGIVLILIGLLDIKSKASASILLEK